MVKHTHHDFLMRDAGDGVPPSAVIHMEAKALDAVWNLGIERGLFDAGGCIRKVALSRLDRDMDDEGDWQRLLSALRDVDELLLVDDRDLPDNPILRRYAELTTARYMKRLVRDGVRCVLATGV